MCSIFKFWPLILETHCIFSQKHTKFSINDVSPHKEHLNKLDG